jgi:16S rRNA (cytosine1402-N4)-methyltransferase
MAAYHEPVLVEEVVRYLASTPPGPWVDGTVGGGGHAAAWLAAAAPDRQLIGLDRDPEALAATRERLTDSRLRLLQGSFAELGRLLEEAGVPAEHQVAAILLDLGVSSHQLDDPRRGFGWKHEDAPLDMRMGRDPGTPTALELIRGLDDEALASILARYGEVAHARSLARQIRAAAAEGRLGTTGDLARVVAEGHRPDRPRRIHPATTVFQALRIAVNRELEALEQVLADAPRLLAPGGRMAVIAYHSLEDRRVKQAFHEGEAGPPRPARLPPPSSWRPTWRVLTRRSVVATQAEVTRNPRARSARLRVAERAAGGAA